MWHYGPKRRILPLHHGSMGMGYGIDVDLSEISCVNGNKRSWPDRVLFTFAVKAGEARTVATFGPRWMVDGETLLLRPEQRLFSDSGPEPRVAVAIHGYDIGRKTNWEDDVLARQLALSAIIQRLDQAGAEPEAGSAWEVGLAAIQLGMGALVPPGDAETIFAFSKVYAAAVPREGYALYHSVTDADGNLNSRYKLVLSVGSRVQWDGR